MKEILIDQINYMTLVQIVEFIYTSKVIISDSSVQNLLAASKMLQIEEIVNACCIYLFVNMDSSNCIGIYDFAQTYGCATLAKYKCPFI